VPFDPVTQRRLSRTRRAESGQVNLGKYSALDLAQSIDRGGTSAPCAARRIAGRHEYGHRRSRDNARQGRVFSMVEHRR